MPKLDANVLWIGGFLVALAVWTAVLLTTSVTSLLHIGVLVDDELDLSIISLPLLVFNLVYIASTIFLLGTFIAFYDSTRKHQRKMKVKMLTQINGDGNSGPLRDLVSVIIPARNEEAVIRKSLLRCLRQTYRNIEVIVVCHNCSDRTFEEAQAVQDRRVRAFSLATAKAGKGIALNFGVKMSRGRYILVLDADGYLSENFIEDALPMFAERNCAAVQGRYVPSNRNYNFVTRMLALEGDLWSAPFNTCRYVLDRRVALGGTGYIIDKDALLEVGGFENHLVDDYELTFRLLRSKFRIAYAPLSVNYDEKPPSLDLMLRQRARWVKGFLDLMRHRVAEPTDILGNLYWVAPLATFASLGLLAMAGFSAIHNVFYGYYPYKYAYISFEVWLLLNVATFLLSAAALVKQYGLAGLRHVAWLPLYMPFSVYYLVVSLRAFTVKSWASTKTAHGFTDVDDTPPVDEQPLAE